LAGRIGSAEESSERNKTRQQSKPKTSIQAWREHQVKNEKRHPANETFDSDQLESSDAASLYNEKFAAPAYLVPRLLLSGHLTMLAGKPKSRKTWIALGLALAVALNRPFLGRPIRTPGRVLFFEFDDDRRQLNDRLHVLLPRLDAKEQQTLKRMTFVHSIDSVRQRWIGELDQMLAAARSCGAPFRLLVIDPYLAIRSDRKKADWVTADYDEIAKLKRLCATHDCTCILVHHLRKAASKFASDNVLGTTGLTAAVDAWWIIIDDPASSATKHLKIQGRSIPETTLQVRFNLTAPKLGICTVDEGVELNAGPAGAEILRLLKREGPKRPSEIATAVRKPRNSVYQLLCRLHKRGLVIKDGPKYAYPW
jgi:hypothetical protein